MVYIAMLAQVPNIDPDDPILPQNWQQWCFLIAVVMLILLAYKLITEREQRKKDRRNK